MDTHEIFMHRCIELAQNGLGTTYPNPLVGSVIVHDGKIIGEGWHRKSGEPHAEVNAVAAVKDASLLKDATIYVSLEPCSHFGKTPPCVDLILESGIPNVVIGTVDPNEKVAGSGVAKLRAAGRNVSLGILAEECREVNRRFFTFHLKKRPYVILKWAESADGFIAPTQKDTSEPVWISNAFSRQLTHKWRTQEQAILVGTKTAIADNPALTARDWVGKNPVRLVIDKTKQVSPESHIFEGQAPTIAFCEKEFSGEREQPSVAVLDFKQDIVPQLLAELHARNLQSLIVEGGRHTLQAFIDNASWDEARIFKSTRILQDGIKAPELTGQLLQHQMIESDQLLIFRQHDQHDYL